MDFELDSDINDLRALCAAILNDNVTRERLDEVERDGGVDLATYRLLGRSGVMEAVVPVGSEPADIGFVGLCQVLEEIGRHTAQVPLWREHRARRVDRGRARIRFAARVAGWGV